MRKSDWMIPLVLLFTVLGSTTAHADTIVTSGGNVTGINGITIAGTTYNVTWGLTIDNTFASSLTNATAINNAIAADLTAFGALGVADSAVNTDIGQVGVAAPSQITLTSTQEPGPLGWLAGAENTAIYSASVSAFPDRLAWDEFTVVAVPEPGTAPLTLAGLGVIAMLMWKRRKDALRHAQAT